MKGKSNQGIHQGYTGTGQSSGAGYNRLKVNGGTLPSADHSSAQAKKDAGVKGHGDSGGTVGRPGGGSAS